MYHVTLQTPRQSPACSSVGSETRFIARLPGCSSFRSVPRSFRAGRDRPLRVCSAPGSRMATGGNGRGGSSGRHVAAAAGEAGAAPSIPATTPLNGKRAVVIGAGKCAAQPAQECGVNLAPACCCPPAGTLTLSVRLPEPPPALSVSKCVLADCRSYRRADGNAPSQAGVQGVPRGTAWRCRCSWYSHGPRVRPAGAPACSPAFACSPAAPSWICRSSVAASPPQAWPPTTARPAHISCACSGCVLCAFRWTCLRSWRHWWTRRATYKPASAPAGLTLTIWMLHKPRLLDGGA